MNDQNFTNLPPTKFVTKIHKFFKSSANFMLVLFYNLFKEKMFTNNINGMEFKKLIEKNQDF